MRELKIGMILFNENRQDESELQKFFTFLETEKLCSKFHFTLVSSEAELCSCSYLYYRRLNGDNDIISGAQVLAEKFPS